MTPHGALHELQERFRAAASGRLAEADTAVVALSGGLDSVVLLHLLRFTPGLARPRLVAAHFDHRMRPGSADDAAWVLGLCAAWDVEARIGEPGARPAPPRSEAEAREARYDFLERVRSLEGARRVLTAHTADDQAETVLLRIVRGTGTRGLAGIPEEREPGIWRPLLGFWRAELEAYAAGACLTWREDPTNRDVGYARNALRHVVLPELERSVAPATRRALVRLAEHAREDEAAWTALLPSLLADAGVEQGPGGVSVSRAALLRLPQALHARILRALAEGTGTPLDDARTRAAVDFAASAASGAAVELGGGIELRRDFDRLRLGPPEAPGAERPVAIPDAGSGEASALIGGRAFRVAWGRAAREGFEDASFPPGALSFPLAVRGWRAGDRIRMPYGTKKLKKLFGERRVPEPARDAVPVLVDASGAVLWVPGVARSRDAAEEAGGELFHVGIARGPAG